MQVAVYGDRIIMDDPAGLWLREQGVPTQYMDVDGKTLESTPHTWEAVKVFRNCGVELPTVMKSGGYAFPGRFSPFNHQLDTADFMAGYERCFVLNSPGTGKTAAAIWAMDFLMQQGIVDRVLVMCPMSCMTAVWADELFNIAPHATQAVVHGSRAARQKLIASDAKWLIINHDGIKTVTEELSDPSNGITAVIVDECTAFKAEGADRTKALKKIVEGRRLIAMTGTPIPQKPVDAYLMAKLINPAAPRYKYEFQDQTMIKVSKFKWVAKPDATAKVYEAMQPAVRFDKSDCLDMPKVMVEHRRVVNTPQQDKFINEIKNEWVVDVQSRTGVDTVTAQNAAIRLGKILQIAQGVIINNDGTVLDVPADPRYQACYDAVVESDSKSVVFVPYKGAIAKLHKYLRAKGITVAVVNGDVSQAGRTKIFREFQDLADPKVLLAHPKTTSHGLTLTAASTTIWFGPTFSSESYEQANNRTNRPGQLHDMRIIHLFSETQESQIFKALQEMSDLQGTLLDLYRRIVE